MEIKVRGLDVSAVKKIDEIAKSQGLSRNMYLVYVLENFTAQEESKSYREQYEALVDRCLKVIQHCMETNRQNSVYFKQFIKRLDGDSK